MSMGLNCGLSEIYFQVLISFVNGYIVRVIDLNKTGMPYIAAMHAIFLDRVVVLYYCRYYLFLVCHYFYFHRVIAILLFWQL